MKKYKSKNNEVRFFNFLTTDDLRFRKAVLYFPFVTATCAFILNWLVLDNSFSMALFTSAFIFLLICFIGLVYEANKRKKLP